MGDPIKRKVGFILGDSGLLDTAKLRAKFHNLGVHVINIRRLDCTREIELIVQDVLEQLQASERPRNIVIGAPESLLFFLSLEASADVVFSSIIQLTQVTVRPVVRKPGRDSDSDEDEWDPFDLPPPKPNDDATELGMIRKHFASHYDGARTNLILTKLSFVHVEKLYDQIRQVVRPKIILMVGAALPSSKEIAQRICEQSGGTYIDVHNVSPQEPRSLLKTIENTIITTASSFYCIDGYPISLEVDYNLAKAPYGPQQLWQMESIIAPVSAAIVFTGSTGSLVERNKDVSIEEANPMLERANAHQESLLCYLGRQKISTYNVNCHECSESNIIEIIENVAASKTNCSENSTSTSS